MSKGNRKARTVSQQNEIIIQLLQQMNQNLYIISLPIRQQLDAMQRQSEGGEEE